jgi:hypothetical protein
MSKDIKELNECYPDINLDPKTKYDKKISQIISLLETLKYNSDVTTNSVLMALNDIRYLVNRLEREIINDNKSIDD